ncbi:MAG: carboxypeptidase regulatory-like domain-containing protein [Candidatus Electrothrix sp. AUS1_2]|nr:carboxypeptidase regulatory-like domain-containing protein [Candidatus Electrothrix sp. AUS1_2]
MDTKVYHQSLPVPDANISCSPDIITVAPILEDGKNSFILVANDSKGDLIYEEFTLWAGNHTLNGYITDADNQMVADANVIIKLSDDQTVQDQIKAVDGQFTFSNLPAYSVIVEADTNDLKSASTAVAVLEYGDSTVYLTLRDFNSPSSIINNDFAKGLDGWEIGAAPVTLITHEEEQQQSLAKHRAESDASSMCHIPYNRNELDDYFSKQNASSYNMIEAMDADMDLMLATAGEGPQSISRTFSTSSGTKNVTIRYRFITSEVPGGYFGSQYNDYYNVKIRNSSGEIASGGNSMNGLGLGAFDAAGHTAWREHSMTVNPEGDTIQADLTVANVADGLLDSSLVVDLIEESSLAITSMQLNDIDDTRLSYLSASPHTYFNGNTRIHGTVTVTGAQDDALESLILEIIQHGQVVASAELAPDVKSDLLQTFGEDEEVSVSSSKSLFNLVPTGIDYTTNGTLSLRARARSQKGEEAQRDLGNVQILRRFTGTNRYGNGRDENVGGDDWAKPSVADFVDNWTALTWGDFSNMNAGVFKPHNSHRTGNDIDGWFTGYNERNAATAQTIIDQLNTTGNRISVIYVTYTAKDGDAFYDAIKTVTLNDGRKATDVKASGRSQDSFSLVCN